MVERHGGRYLARSRNIERLEGDHEIPNLVVLLEWPSRDSIQAFYDSDDYRPYRTARMAGSKGSFFIVTGEDAAGLARLL